MKTNEFRPVGFFSKHSYAQVEHLKQADSTKGAKFSGILQWLVALKSHL